MDAQGEWHDNPVGDDHKSFFSILMTAATGTEYPGAPSARETEFFISEEKSKIDYFGANRRADGTLSYTLSDEPEGTLKLNPRIIKADEHPLLELSDIVAYVCAHAHEVSPKYPFFKEQCMRLAHKMVSVEMFRDGRKTA
ncbi:hypothetical protein [Cupriavidus pauculus]|uniref:hypothetical protein n=1 Tax=Cupriavidus pauculus TaxID=82633 RepID=UPI001EE1EC71|nr:hypothetical protein [Cupriavidus pauculus]GJG96464.1 hypothetical protein CBA19C6_18265 [Cupriavidus pauculus]